MLASASPMLTRTPSLPKARTDSARSAARAANSALFSPRLSQTKLPWASGTNHPSSRSPAVTRSRSSTRLCTLSTTSAKCSQRRDGGRFGDLGHREGRGGDPQVLGEFGPGDAVAHAQSGEAVRLGEGPQDHDVGVLAVHGDAVHGVAGAHEFLVGLVDDHHDVGRNGVDEALRFLGRQDGPGGVVGRAQQDHPGPRGDRGGHGVQVMRARRPSAGSGRSRRRPVRRRSGRPRTSARRR